MKKLALAAVPTLALTLAACGSSDDASVDAQADTVEMPADEALSGVTEEPVADPAANATTADTTTAPTVNENEAAAADAAGERAADVAAQAQAAAAAAEAATRDAETGM